MIHNIRLITDLITANVLVVCPFYLFTRLIIIDELSLMNINAIVVIQSKQFSNMHHKRGEKIRRIKT